MHLVVYARGIYQLVDRWKDLLSGQFLKWRRLNIATGKEEIFGVQLAVRPSVLGTYELVFPKEALADVLSMLNIKSHPDKDYKFEVKVLRRMMGLKPVPKEIFKKAEKISPSLTLNNSERALGSCVVNGVDLHLIGIKEDRRGVIDGYEQEML